MTPRNSNKARTTAPPVTPLPHQRSHWTENSCCPRTRPASAAATADSTACLACRSGTLGSRIAPAAGMPATAAAVVGRVPTVGKAERHSRAAGRAQTFKLTGMGEWKVWGRGERGEGSGVLQICPWYGSERALVRCNRL